MDVYEGILTALLADGAPNVLWIGPDSVATAVEKLRTSSVDVVVLQDRAVIEDFLEQIAELSPGTPVVVFDPSASISDAVHYIRLGAHDVASADPTAIIEAAVEFRRSQRAAESSSESRSSRIGGT